MDFECQIMSDRHTGNSRGFGFVSYLSDEAMQAVLAIPHQLHGKTVCGTKSSEINAN